MLKEGLHWLPLSLKPALVKMLREAVGKIVMLVNKGLEVPVPSLLVLGGGTEWMIMLVLLAAMECLESLCRSVSDSSAVESLEESDTGGRGELGGRRLLTWRETERESESGAGIRPSKPKLLKYPMNKDINGKRKTLVQQFPWQEYIFNKVAAYRQGSIKKNSLGGRREIN